MSLLSQQNKARFIKHCVNLPVSVNAKLKQSAVLIPIVTSGEGHAPGLLFTKRSNRLRLHSGAVSFPGGASDEDDVNIIETALREANEEIGLDKKNVEIWCSMPPIPDRINNGLGQVTPVVGIVHQSVGVESLLVNTEEVQEVMIVPLTTLLDPRDCCLPVNGLRTSEHVCPSTSFSSYAD